MHKSTSKNNQFYLTRPRVIFLIFVFLYSQLITPAQADAALTGTIEKMTKLEAGKYELVIKGETGLKTYVIEQPTIIGALVQADQLEAGTEIFQAPKTKDGQADENIPEFLKIPQIPQPPKIQEIPQAPQIQKIPQPPKAPEIPNMKALQELQAKMQPPPSAPGGSAAGAAKPQGEAPQQGQQGPDPKEAAMAMMQQAMEQGFGAAGAQPQGAEGTGGDMQGKAPEKDEEPPPPPLDSLAKIETAQSPLSEASGEENPAAKITKPVFKKIVKVAKQQDTVTVALAAAEGSTEDITFDAKQIVFKVISVQDLKPGMKVKINLVETSPAASVQAVTVL